jgi:regulatory protein
LAASDASRAYVAALKMLAGRELSESQVRRRLGRRDHDPEHIDSAVARLRADGALDDARAARVIARHTASVRGQGKLRARLRMDAAGIDRATASAAVDEVFAEIDAGALLQAALAKRLRGRSAPADRSEQARLFRYLTGQGFDADRVMEAIRDLADRSN